MVCCRYVGMRSKNETDPAIHVVAHRIFFARRFGVEVDNDGVGLATQRHALKLAIYSGARIVYRRHIALPLRLDDKHNTAKLHFNLGMFYYQQKQFTQARAHMLEAQALFDKVGDKQSAQRADQALRWL